MSMVVITGASKGIGYAVAEAFAALGKPLVLVARDRARLQSSVEILSKKYSVEIIPIAADLSIHEEVRSLIDKILQLARPVEVLVNNAGSYSPGQLHSESEGQLDFMIHTNLMSAYHLTRGLLPRMMADHKGYIFNMCSTASITPYLNGGSYCISKFALYGFTKVLRQEMIPYGIKVTAILPGATKTPSWDGVDLPAERFIDPTDVANAIVQAYTMSAGAVVEEILIRPTLGDI